MNHTMQGVGECLPDELRRKVAKLLGPEESLRRLWPTIVGSGLTRSVRLKCLRGATLIVSVPDKVWQGSLASLEGLILERANRLCGRAVARSIEFVVDVGMTTEAGAGLPRNARQGVVSSSAPSSALTARSDIPASLISDVALREAFVCSAAKYFARGQVSKKTFARGKEASHEDHGQGRALRGRPRES
jgi:hypothetical protein